VLLPTQEQQNNAQNHTVPPLLFTKVVQVLQGFRAATPKPTASAPKTDSDPIQTPRAKLPPSEAKGDSGPPRLQVLARHNARTTSFTARYNARFTAQRSSLPRTLMRSRSDRHHQTREPRPPSGPKPLPLWGWFFLHWHLSANFLHWYFCNHNKKRSHWLRNLSGQRWF
jgi:hypothetical protein